VVHSSLNHSIPTTGLELGYLQSRDGADTQVEMDAGEIFAVVIDDEKTKYDAYSFAYLV
jgi:hypothetical protein